MKLTTKQLRYIIQEELSKVLEAVSQDELDDLLKAKKGGKPKGQSLEDLLGAKKSDVQRPQRDKKSDEVDLSDLLGAKKPKPNNPVNQALNIATSVGGGFAKRMTQAAGGTYSKKEDIQGAMDQLVMAYSEMANRQHTGNIDWKPSGDLKILRDLIWEGIPRHFGYKAPGHIPFETIVETGEAGFNVLGASNAPGNHPGFRGMVYSIYKYDMSGTGSGEGYIMR